MAEDDVAAILAHFCDATGRLNASPADFQTAVEWVKLGIPRAVAIRGIDQKVESGLNKGWVRRMPLEWADPDVREWFDTWRRSR